MPCTTDSNPIGYLPVQFIDDGNLILPSHLSREQPQRQAIVGHYLSYHDATGNQSTIAELMQLLGRLRRSDVIRWTSALLELCHQKDGLTAAFQASLVRDLIEPDLASHLIEMVGHGERCVVFHRRQLWLLLQLSILVCDESRDPIDDTAQRQLFGRACLMAGDFLHQIELVHIAPATDAVDDTLKYLITVLVSHSDSTTTNDVLARAHAFWFDSLADPAVRAQFARLNLGADFNELFSRHFGISLSEFFFIAASLYFTFLKPAVRRPISPAIVDATVWSGGLFSEADKKLVLDALSIGVDQFAAFLFGTPRQSWATDPAPLLSRPLIEVFPGRFVCPDLSYFRLFFLDGIFWMIDAAANTSEWQKFFGDLFAWYIRQPISSFAITSEILHQTFFPDCKLRGEEYQACDGIIVWERLAVLAEYNGTRLTTRQKAGVQGDVTTDAITAAVGTTKKGVGQLAKNIVRILRGDVVVCGNKVVDLSPPKKLVPLLVWYEESAGNNAVRGYLQSILDEMLADENVTPGRVGPLLLFTPRDMELFEECTTIYHAETSYAAEKLMQEYVDFVTQNPRDPLCMFQWFATAKFEGLPRGDGYVARKKKGFIDDLQSHHRTRNETEPPQH